MCGHQNYGNTRQKFEEVVHQFQATAVRHIDIAQDGIELGSFRRFSGLMPAADNGDAKAIEAQTCFEQQADRFIVIGNQNVRRICHSRIISPDSADLVASRP